MRLFVLLMMAVVGLVALEIRPHAKVTSNYVFRGLSQTQKNPAMQVGVSVDQSGFYVGVWGSNVSYDANLTKRGDANTTHFRVGSDFEVNLYGGYILKGNRVDVHLGFIDYRIRKNNRLIADVMSEFYGALWLRSPAINAVLKVSYDTKHTTDPTNLELSFKDTRTFPADFTYGWYVDSEDTYYSINLEYPLALMRLKGNVGVGYSKYMPKVGSETNNISVFYAF